MKSPVSKYFLNTGCFLLSLLCLCWQALNNGYALAYPDMGTYIAAGFSGDVPVDRPVMYAFFVRHISMAFSLWLVIVMQAIVVTVTLLITLRYFFNSAYYFLHTFLLIAGL